MWTGLPGRSNGSVRVVMTVGVSPQLIVLRHLVRRQDLLHAQVRLHVCKADLPPHAFDLPDQIVYGLVIALARRHEVVEPSLEIHELLPKTGGAGVHRIERGLCLHALVIRQPDPIRQIENVHRPGVMIQLGDLGKTHPMTPTIIKT